MDVRRVLPYKVKICALSQTHKNVPKPQMGIEPANLLISSETL